jgi:hypothetical protein
MQSCSCTLYHLYRISRGALESCLLLFVPRARSDEWLSEWEGRHLFRSQLTSRPYDR